MLLRAWTPSTMTFRRRRRRDGVASTPSLIPINLAVTVVVIHSLATLIFCGGHAEFIAEHAQRQRLNNKNDGNKDDYVMTIAHAFFLFVFCIVDLSDESGVEVSNVIVVGHRHHQYDGDCHHYYDDDEDANRQEKR